MPKKAISRIKFEIDQIDRLLKSYDDLFSQIQSEPPNLVEITALGAVIHSFYNGLENIFLIVAKRIDKQLPQGEEWHRQILQQMKTPTSQRPPIIQPETAVLLADYLAFRHFFRHSYTILLEWDKLQKLILPLADVWNKTKAELILFTKIWPNKP